VAHEHLATPEAVEWWRSYWREWLEALDPDAEAMWDDTRLGLETFNAYERMGIVTDTIWGPPVDRGLRMADRGQGSSIPPRRTRRSTHLDHDLNPTRLATVTNMDSVAR